MRARWSDQHKQVNILDSYCILILCPGGWLLKSEGRIIWIHGHQTALAYLA
jgi:hypothetical protein